MREKHHKSTGGGRVEKGKQCVFLAPHFCGAELNSKCTFVLSHSSASFLSLPLVSFARVRWALLAIVQKKKNGNEY